MFPPTEYLAWARRLYGQVRFDLATSGIPAVPLAELGLPGSAEIDDPSGWTRLREAIAAYNDVSATQATAALGTTHALWLTYASVAGSGDEVVIEDPAYEPLLRAAEGIGAGVVRFARDPSERFALDPDRVARAMTPRTRLVVVTNLHNPSGVRASDEVLIAIASVAESHSAFLLVDEVYAPFDALVDVRGVFRGSARRLAPNIVTVSSLTKCYGLGSHRIGWLLAPAEISRHAEDAVTASCAMLPLSHAHLGLRAFDRIGALAARARGLLAGKRSRVEAWVAREGLVWSAPTEGLFGFAIVPGAGDLTAAIEEAARTQEVLVAAGSFFGISNGFRLAWSAPMDALEEGLARLSAILRAAPPA